MTNEQAIKILTEAGFGINIWNTPTGYCEEDWDEALQMAIEALKKQDDEPVGCYGCVHERHGNQVCDACSQWMEEN